MRVLRSSLFVAATAVIAAACGDKVNIVQPSNTATINSVLVTPSTATISVGQTVVLTASVNASTGVTPTVAWTTSSSAAASLSGTSGGSVTVSGVASSPGVAICATATASGANSVVNCATVVVQPATQVVPATVQITSITGANLNTPVAVPPGTVAGQINVSVTANPGTARLDSVVVMINGKSAGTQTLTAAQAAALRYAADQATANQQVVAPIVFSVNTAAYNATTGAVTFPNGSATVSAVAYGHQGRVRFENTASTVLSLLGNADGFQVAFVERRPRAANDATGFAWWGNGTLTVNALPVMYSGKTVGHGDGRAGRTELPGGTCVAGAGAPVSVYDGHGWCGWSVVVAARSGFSRRRRLEHDDDTPNQAVPSTCAG